MVTNMGNMNIKIFDRVIKKLKQVRHTPELKRNLISLGILENIGYSFKDENGYWKVIKGSLVVIKEKGNDSIYELNGMSVTGRASVQSRVNFDKTSLGHLRLSYISEKCLKELSRHGVLGDNIIGWLEFCE